METDTVIATIISLGGFCYFKSKLNEKDALAAQIKNTKTYFPSALLKKFKDPQFRSNVSVNPDNSNELVMKAFVEGYVQTKNPLKSSLDPTKEVVLSQIQKREIRSNDSVLELFNFPQRILAKAAKNAVYSFNLKDPENSDVCKINRNIHAETFNSMEKIAEKQHLKELSKLESFILYGGSG